MNEHVYLFLKFNLALLEALHRARLRGVQAVQAVQHQAVTPPVIMLRKVPVLIIVLLAVFPLPARNTIAAK